MGPQRHFQKNSDIFNSCYHYSKRVAISHKQKFPQFSSNVVNLMLGWQREEIRLEKSQEKSNLCPVLFYCFSLKTLFERQFYLLFTSKNNLALSFAHSTFLPPSLPASLL